MSLFLNSEFYVRSSGPPLYSESIGSIIISALVLGSLWGAMMRFISWNSLTLINVVASIFFGVTMALFFRWRQIRERKKLALPSWEGVLERAKEYM